MKVSEEWVFGGLLTAFVAIMVVVGVHEQKVHEEASATSQPPPRAYRASEFRRLVLLKSKAEVIAAVGQPDTVSDLAGGGQSYGYDLHPSWKFQIVDDETGVHEQGADVHFDAMGQAEDVNLY